MTLLHAIKQIMAKAQGKGRRENSEQAKEAQWITEHIPMLECKRFVPTSVIG